MDSKRQYTKNDIINFYLLLWIELSQRNIVQDKTTPLYKETKKLINKLKEYGLDEDFIDTFQKTGINAIFADKYGIKIKKQTTIKRRLEMSNIKFEFFPKIINRGSNDKEDNWYVEGFAATTNPIDDKESPYPVVIPDEELDKAAIELRGSTVFLNHDSKQHIGKVVDMVRKGTKLWTKIFISKTVPTTWKQIQEEVLNCFSIKGTAGSTIDKFDKKLGKMVRFVRDLMWREVSVVGLPADTEAKSLCWYVARAIENDEGQKIVDETKEKIAAFTRERMKLKDIFPEIAEKVALKYNKHADSLELIKKQQLISEGGLVEGENAVICYITTGAQDRYNEILDPNGMIIDDYVKNPIVLWCHDHRQLPVGKNEGLWQDEKGWIGKTVYAVNSVPQAKMNYQYRKDGNPLAISVGFIPLEWIDHNKDDDDGGWSIFGPPPESGKQQILQRTYTKWILLEYSDVPVPANPECLPIIVMEMDGTKKYMKEFKKEVTDMSKKEKEKEVIEETTEKKTEVTTEEKTEKKTEEKTEEKIEEKKEENTEEKKEEEKEVKIVTIEEVEKLIDEKLATLKGELIKELKSEKTPTEETTEKKPEEETEEKKEEEKEEETEKKSTIERQTVVRSETTKEDKEEEKPATPSKKLGKVLRKIYPIVTE